MAVDFPSSPINGQTLTVGNVLYTYNAALGTWKAAPLGTALPFNYIINSGMQISQQNAVGTSGIVSGFYYADQWMIAISGVPYNKYGSLVNGVTLQGSPKYISFGCDAGP